MKNQLGGKIMKEFAVLRATTYSYLITTMEIKKQKTQRNVL